MESKEPCVNPRNIKIIDRILRLKFFNTYFFSLSKIVQK
jgi:hypothetical protein